jgi:hypothetical protein
MKEETVINNTSSHSWHIAEILFACAGLFMLISVGILYVFQDFTLWNIAKVFYGVGVVAFVRYA